MGIVKGLQAGDPEQVSSPTFTLIHEYPVASGRRAKVYHVDLSRLDHPREVSRLGLEELLETEAVVLIEWGERFPQLMPAVRIEIRIQAGDADQREIMITNIGT